MSPPIREDSGDSIDSIRLGDGSEISEVRTGAGDVVFSAAPDTSMFQSPIYQWAVQSLNLNDGATISSWTDSLAGIQASAVGAPKYLANQDGKEAVDPDGSDDGFDWSGDADLPTGSDPFSIAATVYYPSSVSDFSVITSFGRSNNGEASELYANFTGTIAHSFIASDLTGSTIPSNTWATVGVRYDGSNRKQRGR